MRGALLVDTRCKTYASLTNINSACICFASLAIATFASSVPSFKLGTDDANVLCKGCKASACVVRRTLTHDAKHMHLWQICSACICFASLMQNICIVCPWLKSLIKRLFICAGYNIIYMYLIHQSNGSTRKFKQLWKILCEQFLWLDRLIIILIKYSVLRKCRFRFIMCVLFVSVGTYIFVFSLGCWTLPFQTNSLPS